MARHQPLQGLYQPRGRDLLESARIWREQRPHQAQKRGGSSRQVIEIDGSPGQILRPHFIVEQVGVKPERPHQIPEFVTKRIHELAILP